MQTASNQDQYTGLRAMKRIINAFSYSGDAKRAEFLRFIPVALILWLGAGYVDEQYLAPNLCLINENWICYLPGEVREGFSLDKLVAVLLLIPFFAVSIRRLNRHTKPFWYSALALPGLIVLWFWVYRPAEPLAWYWPILALLLALPFLFFMLKRAKNNKRSKSNS